MVILHAERIPPLQRQLAWVVHSFEISIQGFRANQVTLWLSREHRVSMKVSATFIHKDNDGKIAGDGETESLYIRCPVWLKALSCWRESGLFLQRCGPIRD
jgi:hypothetical protein